MRYLIVIASMVLCGQVIADDTALPAADRSLSLVVMDPLAAPLSCPCVEGYAQRQYDKLADYLAERLGRPVHVTFAESFEKALEKEAEGNQEEEDARETISVTPVAVSRAATISVITSQESDDEEDDDTPTTDKGTVSALSNVAVSVSDGKGVLPTPANVILPEGCPGWGLYSGRDR